MTKNILHSEQVAVTTQKVKIVLAGNPNSGKTTLFNNLTGSRQHVGNYPGVTVEKKEGLLNYQNFQIAVSDLPGTYSLTAYSLEEKIARDVIINEKPDWIVNIIDVSNLERNLYLTMQLKELGVPMILVFNMWDMLIRKGTEIDVSLFSRLINIPVVKMIASKKTGHEQLLEEIIKTPEKEKYTNQLLMDKKLEHYINRILLITEKKQIISRWQAIKLLERDSEVRETINDEEVLANIDRELETIFINEGETAETILAEQRYGLISGICRKTVRSTIVSRVNISDKIDFFVTHRLIGIPLFLVFSYLVFQLTFTLGEPLMTLIETIFYRLGDFTDNVIFKGSESILASLLVDGVIAGVGGVLIFLPNILLLFLALSVMEDTGYMARVSFIMDKIMNKIGLQGKSFIPMIIGFGCTVPAIMACRTLENKRDRFATIMISPLISCSARMPIYALLIPAFFPKKLNAPMLWIIYMTGIILAIILAKILRTKVFKGETNPFIMELPPYRIPSLKSVFLHMWDRAGMYLKKAGTLILALSIILWFMSSFPKLKKYSLDYDDLKNQTYVEYLNIQDKEIYENKIIEINTQQQNETLAYTISGKIGKFMEPVTRIMGFDWRIGTALIGAFAAKEVFVSQMSIIFSVSDVRNNSDALREQLKQAYSPLVAFCIMLFCLISAPCMATIAITKRETNSWKWALAQLFGLTFLAFLITSLVFQAGSILKIGL